MRGYQKCDGCGKNTLHEDGVCKVCAAKDKQRQERIDKEQERISKKLATFKTEAEKLEFLIREIFTEKIMDAHGHIKTLSEPVMRGRSAKNIKRLLRTGKRRLVKANAEGVDLGVLPPESMIRKRAEANWRRRITPRGYAGRIAAKEAATTTKRKGDKCSAARVLRDEGKTIAEIARIIKREERTVRRYLNGR